MRAILVLLALSDVQARFQLAAVPGVDFVVGGTQALAPSPIRPAPLGDINWNSAPSEIVPLAPEAGMLDGARVLLETERGQPLLAVRNHTVVLLAQPSGSFARWPYFNYLLHMAACQAAGIPPPRFADWGGSPMPHSGLRRMAAIGLLALWAIAFLLYRVARSRGRARPDAATRFFAAANASADPNVKTQRPEWAQAGFSRPLSGLLTLLASMLIFVGPYFILQSLVATRIQPFPEADGLWRTTWDALWIAWMTFDLGTQTAFVKYFAEHRVKDPQQALADAQFYVWWQVFARVLEATVLIGVAFGYLPWTRYALYAPFVALYGACYAPGVNGVGKLMCWALQRFDYYNLLDMLEYRALIFILPIPFVLLGRAWGAAHPMYGEAFGAAVGMGIGQFATNTVMLLLGLGVLKLLRLPLGPIFLAQFDRRVVKRQLVYGAKLTLGQEPYRLTTFLESVIIVRSLADFTAWLGIRDLLSGRLLWLYQFAWGYYSSGVSAISEAYGAGKRLLTQYYVARYFQFGFLFSAVVFSLLMAVGPTFIHGALGPQWWRASNYLLLAAVAGMFYPTAWVSDSLQQGAGRPGINTVVMIIEQATRLALFYVLIPRLGFVGIYAGTLIAIGLKAVVAWTINHTRIVPLRLPPWTSIGAPLLAGVLNYGLWRGVTHLLHPDHPTTVLALFFVAGAVSFPFGFFACGLLGGYDSDALDELARGARMSALVRPICRVLSGAARLGARLSPRPPRRLALAEGALAEAAELDAAARLTASQ